MARMSRLYVGGARSILSSGEITAHFAFIAAQITRFTYRNSSTC